MLLPSEHMPASQPPGSDLALILKLCVLTSQPDLNAYGRPSSVEEWLRREEYDERRCALLQQDHAHFMQWMAKLAPFWFFFFFFFFFFFSLSLSLSLSKNPRVTNLTHPVVLRWRREWRSRIQIELTSCPASGVATSSQLTILQAGRSRASYKDLIVHKTVLPFAIFY